MYKVEAKSGHDAVAQLFTQYAATNPGMTSHRFQLDGGSVTIRVNKKKATRLKAETR